MWFDSAKMEALMSKLTDGHVSYELGAKVWRLGRTQPEQIHALDCSGFIEYVLYWTTDPHVNIPSGSSNQESWCRTHLTEGDYATDAPRIDGILRIAFRHRTRRRVGHVWFILNGSSLESTERGGGDGPTSMNWSVRLDEADSCFLLGPLMPPRLTPI
jgi:hypothetical protein